ncbi:E1 [Tursiops truncatus papillomavirus 5]|uniref:Replication protein E1 n=1 Tax=Tursiops truncatus papillomavirus 5 TaxID=1144381 RepID=H6UYP0_PSPV|nr:E1 [Tursiops truncatus papillomavirus 5]
MDTSPGTSFEGGSNDWVLVEACEAGGGGLDDEDEDEDEEDLGEDLLDFIDDSGNFQNVVTQDYCRQLQTEQQRLDDEKAVHALKRKFLDSPKSKVDCDLSPRLAAISLQEKQRTARARRRLYTEKEHGDSLETRSETEVVCGNTQVQKIQSLENVALRNGASPNSVGRANSSEEVDCTEMLEDYACSVSQLLRAGKPRVALLGLFKSCFGCSFTDLTRCFKSDKTVNEDWIFVLVGVPCCFQDAISDMLKPTTVFSHITVTTCKYGLLVLALVQWNTSKSRETILNLLTGLFSVEKQQILCEPPKIRHPAAAMFWYKKALSNACVVTGDMPSWILKLISIQDQLGENCTFSLSTMIQWAYDNGYDNECDIAYGYAVLADEDKNADAFLRSNCQAKFVKDCANMVRLYRRAEMKRMNMNQWITHRCSLIEGEGDYRHILNFLKFQNIEIMPFLSDLRQFLKGIPKRNCIVIFGPANTGKSLFAMSLINMLGGKILSFVNSNSHFWLQPLADAKVALLDDATPNTWDYADTFLRNMLDGNPISLDTKHKAHVQITCPPIIITTNTNIMENQKWKYLHSRVRMLSFLNECPLNSRGDPEFHLNKVNWKAFFKKCRTRLALDEGNEGENGTPLQPLRCAARGADGPD